MSRLRWSSLALQPCLARDLRATGRCSCDFGPGLVGRCTALGTATATVRDRAAGATLCPTATSLRVTGLGVAVCGTYANLKARFDFFSGGSRASESKSGSATACLSWARASTLIAFFIMIHQPLGAPLRPLGSAKRRTVVPGMFAKLFSGNILSGQGC